MFPNLGDHHHSNQPLLCKNLCKDGFRGGDKIDHIKSNLIKCDIQVRSAKYTDYLVDGEVVFPPKEPHTQAKLFIKATTSTPAPV